MAAIVPAAGRGRRFKTKLSKILYRLQGRPLLIHTLSNLKRSYPFKEIIVLTQKNEIPRMRALLGRYGLRRVRVEEGGASRADSVKRGVEAIKSGVEWVLVHDAARPFVSKGVVQRTLAAAKASGAALCAVPATATVKRVGVRDGIVSGTEDRRTLWLAQTPQVFRKRLLLERYKKLGKKALAATDEAALFDGSRTRVRVVEGEMKNIKVTTEEDLGLLEFYLKK